MQVPKTSSPGCKPVTLAPTDSTRPAKSCPRTRFFGARTPETARIAYGTPVADMPVADEGRCGEHAHQHLVGGSDRLFDVLEVQNVRGAVPVLHDRLHPCPFRCRSR